MKRWNERITFVNMKRWNGRITFVKNEEIEKENNPYIYRMKELGMKTYTAWTPWSQNSKSYSMYKWFIYTDSSSHPIYKWLTSTDSSSRSLYI